MERDSRGRFLPGNQVAKGNKGNRKPKYGNSNALNHGLRRGYTGLLPSQKGGVSIYKMVHTLEHYQTSILTILKMERFG